MEVEKINTENPVLVYHKAFHTLASIFSYRRLINNYYTLSWKGAGKIYPKVPPHRNA
jgi:hypothetical protein